MNEEQKAIAEEIFYMFDQEHITPIEALTEMEALLQEMIAAPEPEPVAWMVKNGFVCSAIYQRQKDADNYAADQQKRHDLGGSLASFCVIPLYTAPPVPSVPDNNHE